MATACGWACENCWVANPDPEGSDSEEEPVLDPDNIDQFLDDPTDEQLEMIELAWCRFRTAGIGNFLFALPVFFLADHGLVIAAYIVIFIQALIGFTLQIDIAAVLDDFVCSAPLKLKRTWEENVHGPFEICGCKIVGFQAWLYAAASTTLEYIDPPMDALTAGASMMPSNASRTAFSNSWKNKALVGSTIASWGLPFALRVIWIFSLVLQFVGFLHHLRRAHDALLYIKGKKTSPSRDFGGAEKDMKHEAQRLFWYALSYAGQCASLEFSAGMADFIGTEVCGIRVLSNQVHLIAHMGSIITRILILTLIENMPSIHLAVTLIGLSLKFGQTGPFEFANLSAAFCVVTSVASMVSAGTSMWNWKYPFKYADKAGTLVSFILFAFVFLEMVRLAGAFTCEDNNFSIDPFTWGCRPW